MDLTKVKKNEVAKGVSGKSFLFYGPPGTRKTTIASQFPKSIIAATEIGYKQIPNVTAVDIDSWATFTQFVTQLKRKEVKELFNTVVIDTVDLLYDQCVNYVCNLNGVKGLGDLGFGKGFKECKSTFRRAITTITQQGYSVVFIAHCDVKKDEDGKVISIAPMLDKQPKALVEELTDIILYVEKDKINEVDTVIAYSSLPSNVMTKTRIRNLAPSFEFTYENLVSELDKALNNYSEAYGEEIKLVENNVPVEEEKKVSFDEIKTQTIEIATKMLDNDLYKEKAAEIIGNAMKGVRLSEATPAYKQVLIDLGVALNSLVEEN